MAKPGLVKSELVEVETEDEQIVRAAGVAVGEFFGRLRVFFQVAQNIERAAVATMSRAQVMTVPASLDEDVALQTFIRRISADIKTAETHWGITSTVHGFHRRLVAARKRSTDALEEAGRLANAHHNTYVAVERRRVEEEQRRVVREAEQRAQAIRVQELAEMEAQALAAEADSPILSAREQSFVALVVSGSQPWTAASHAGFKDCVRAAVRLMATAKIQDAIQAKRTAHAIRQQALAVKAAPLDPVSIENVPINLAKAPGASDSTTWAAELFDQAAFVGAVFAGQLGIPRDVLKVDEVALNGYARSLHKLIDRWPGVRAKSTTKVV